VLAPKRSERPLSFQASEVHAQAREQCPLCEGREDWTPPETWALRPGDGGPDTPGWLVRAVPNKFPLLAEGRPAPERQGTTEHRRGQLRISFLQRDLCLAEQSFESRRVEGVVVELERVTRTVGADPDAG